jgi:hypothetical protein
MRETFFKREVPFFIFKMLVVQKKYIFMPQFTDSPLNKKNENDT